MKFDVKHGWSNYLIIVKDGRPKAAVAYINTDDKTMVWYDYHGYPEGWVQDTYDELYFDNSNDILTFEGKEVLHRCHVRIIGTNEALIKLYEKWGVVVPGVNAPQNPIFFPKDVPCTCGAVGKWGVRATTYCRECGERAMPPYDITPPDTDPRIYDHKSKPYERRTFERLTKGDLQRKDLSKWSPAIQWDDTILDKIKEGELEGRNFVNEVLGKSAADAFEKAAGKELNTIAQGMVAEKVGQGLRCRVCGGDDFYDNGKTVYCIRCGANVADKKEITVTFTGKPCVKCGGPRMESSNVCQRCWDE